MENRHGLIVDALVTAATGTAERDAALTMLGELPDGGRVTVGGDKNFDTRDFVRHTSREMGVTPHVAQYPETDHRGSAIDGRTTRHAGYDISQRKRKLVEQAFGWMKTVGLLAQTPPSGRSARRVGLHFPCGGLQPGPACARCWRGLHEGERVRAPGNIAMNPGRLFEDNVGVLEVTFSVAC